MKGVPFRTGTEIIVAVSLLLLLIPPISAASPNSYSVNFVKRGTPLKEFIATKEEMNGNLLFESPVNSDLNIIAVDSTKTSFADGNKVTLKYENQNLTHESVTGVLHISEESYRFNGDNGLDLIINALNLKPNPPTETWVSPFLENDRKASTALKKRIIGRFGDSRSTVKRGHKHAGVDLKGSYGEDVYPIANGQIVFVSNKDFNSTVIVEHRLSNGELIYSKYVHLMNIKGLIGEIVTDTTKIGQLFNKEEFRKSGFNNNHFHLEIRKSYADKGKASSYSMSMKALEEYCFNPVEFLERKFRE